MADTDSEPKNDLDECDYEKLAKLAERITRLEEENRQLSEMVEKAEERTWRGYVLSNTIFIIILFVFIMLTILQTAH